MLELAITTSIIGFVIFLYFLHRAYHDRSRRSILFSLFGLIGCVKFAVVYTYLNLDPGSTLIPLLRMTDYLLMGPLFVIALEMIHSNAIVRSKRVNPKIRQVSYFIPASIVTILGLLFLFVDVQTVRMFAVILGAPAGLLVIVYYIFLMHDNPLRINRPEFAWGSIIVLLSLLLWMLSEGILAGLLGLFEHSILLQAIAMILGAFGGIIHGFSSFTDTYSGMGIGLIVVGNDYKIKSFNLIPEHEHFDLETELEIVRLIVSNLNDSIASVFETDVEEILTVASLEMLSPTKKYQIAIQSHQLDLDGRPLTVSVAINDVTNAILQKDVEHLAVVGKLAGGMGHELRNPLATIKAAIFYLQENVANLDKESIDALDISNVELDRATKIIQQLLDFAYPKPLSKEMVSLADLIRSALGTIHCPENIRVTIIETTNFPKIYVDSEQLTKVFTALFLNSFQSISGEGSVVVNLNVLDTIGVSIELSDDGAGIPEDHLDNLFEPLFSTKESGIGLGLPIAQSIVTAHDGDISLQNNHDGGATVSIILPVLTKL